MLVKLLALLVPLGLDTFAVTAALGISRLTPRRRLRVSLLLATFEAGMPLLGLALGAPLGQTIGPAADYAAGAVLVAVGAFALVLTDRDEEQRAARLTSMDGWRSVLLGLSVSLDELALGFTLGLLRVPIVPVIALIAAQALVVSQVGLRLGGRLGPRSREGAEALAAVALVLIGIVVVGVKVLGITIG